MSKPGAVGSYCLNAEQVKRYLPHRYPFLLVDRILEIQTPGSVDEPVAEKVGVQVTGLKNISWNEPWCAGHFPEFTLFPGVFIIEAMAQVASFSVYPFFKGHEDKIARDFRLILVGVDEARFRKPVVPGDTLLIKTKVKKQRGELWVFEAEASVDGQLVAEAEIKANLSLKGKSL